MLNQVLTLTFTLATTIALAWSAGDPPPSDTPTTQPTADESTAPPPTSQSADDADAEATAEDTAAKRAERLAERRAQRDAEQRAEEVERDLRKAIGRYFSDVRLFHSRFLEPGERGGDTKKFDEGRRRILALNDPLAVPAIIEVLSKGTPAVRRVMIEALDAFHDEDDATGYLIVVALIDPDPDLRQAAAIALLKRKSDQRIIQDLRRALDSEEEVIIRNAATALGVLGDKSVIPDLIDRLSMELVIEVPVTRETLFSGIGQTYVSGYRVKAAPGVAQVEPIVSGVSSGVSLGFGEDEPMIEYKTVHRTEVQEALIALTGVNYGFDRDQWLEWWKKYKD